LPVDLCNTLHHTATHCNTLQHTAIHCNTLQHTATHCYTLQHTTTHCNTLQLISIEPTFENFFCLEQKFSKNSARWTKPFQKSNNLKSSPPDLAREITPRQ